MAAIASYFDRKPSTARPGLSSIQRNPDPASPQTPQRPLTSAFNSPSLSYRVEEDALIFEFGARHISSGFAGEASPRCTYTYGPEVSRRVGDYRQWLPEYRKKRRKWRSNGDCYHEYELWRMDLRGFDLGLFEDKIERAVREAHSKHFLQDCRSRRVVLIMPSILPHLLLSSILSIIFEHFQHPSVTLYPSALLCTVAAGCRSACIVDIGWMETVMTVIDDYKEVAHRRTERAMKRLTVETAKSLHRKLTTLPSTQDSTTQKVALGEADIELCEIIAERMSTCHVNINGEGIPEESSDHAPADCSVPSPWSPQSMLQVPSSTFHDTVETTFFATAQNSHDIDDHERPLHQVLFHLLLSLPPDVRGSCMSRIIITGGGSHIPGLKTRLLNELSSLVSSRGWDPVNGKIIEERRKRLQEVDGKGRSQKSLTTDKDASLIKDITRPTDPEEENHLPACQQPQTQDEITKTLLRNQTKGTKPSLSGQVRAVETLGAWAGASMLSSLKVKGVVEIDRDVFLQSGMAGARKEVDSSNEGSKAKRQSMGAAAAARSGGGDRRSWTLGNWA